MQKADTRSLTRRVAKGIGIGLLVTVSALGLLVFLVWLGLFGKLPTADELQDLRNEEATLVLDANGALIGKIFAQDRTNIRFADLPGHLVDALIATEDQRFFTHEGVDVWSYLRVLFRTILGGDESGGGGSTISQQIIKNLYGRERFGPLTLPVNKIKEAIVARRLEQVYSKDDVLTLYLNSVPFGENLYGIEAAAQRFFSKPASRLNIQESAVLVGMLKANTTYNPRLYPERSRERRDQVLALMRDNGDLARTVCDSLLQLPIGLRYRGLDALDAYGYFTAHVEAQARAILAKLPRGQYDIEKDGLRIHTTLDTALQRAAMSAARKQLMRMQPRLDRELRLRKARSAWERSTSKAYGKAWKLNSRKVRDVFQWTDDPPDTMSFRDSLWHYQRMLHAAVLIMEPSTGRVLAWVGGNDHRALPFDLVTSRRPIASTIKPVLYAAALSSGLRPCDHFDNTEHVYADRDNWHPRNFDGTSGGQVAMWYALAHSMNLPTIDLYFRTGEAPIRSMFNALGLPDSNVDKPALALGASDVSLQEIVRAYGTFANEGSLVTPRSIDRITDAHGQVIYQAKRASAKLAMAPSVATTITTMLERAVNEGTGSSLRTRYGLRSDIAAKTGTSQDYSDAWFVAYTPGLVIGTWVGARERSIHFNSAEGSGAQLALPIPGDVLSYVERDRKWRKRLLTPFDRTPLDTLDMNCPGRWSGADQFFEDLFKSKKEKEPRAARDSTRKAKRKGFWESLFPKKRSR